MSDHCIQVAHWPGLAVAPRTMVSSDQRNSADLEKAKGGDLKLIDYGKAFYYRMKTGSADMMRPVADIS